MARTNTTIFAVVDFTAYRSDTFNVFVDFFEDNGDDYDLTQWDTLEMQVKAFAKDKEAFVTLTLGDGLTVSAGNRLTININADDMNIPDSQVFYDVEGNNITERKTILKGNILIDQDITRP